jgi:hypothetical protein
MCSGSGMWCIHVSLCLIMNFLASSSCSLRRRGCCLLPWTQRHTHAGSRARPPSPGAWRLANYAVSPCGCVWILWYLCVCKRDEGKCVAFDFPSFPSSFPRSCTHTPYSHSDTHAHHNRRVCLSMPFPLHLTHLLTSTIICTHTTTQGGAFFRLSGARGQDLKTHHPPPPPILLLVIAS